MVEAARHTTIENGQWLLPEHVQNPQYVIPDAVLWHVVRRLGLDEPHKIGVDLMCGNGTIPNFINEVGGCCFGVEIDAAHCKIATAAAAQLLQFSPPAGWLIGQKPGIVHGDCTTVDLRRNNGEPLRASYIYTSPPFREILNGTLNKKIARAIGTTLVPPGLLGFVLIDSADEAVRDGAMVNPAAATIAYLRQVGLVLLDRIAFRIKDAPPGCDDQFTELMFVRQEELNFWGTCNPTPLSGPEKARTWLAA